MDKGYLATFKGKKVTFKVVKHGADLKVKFVDAFPDYKVKAVNGGAFSKETIKVEIVNNFPDVKLKWVNAFADFDVHMDE